jgi:hypothetical protein
LGPQLHPSRRESRRQIFSILTSVVDEFEGVNPAKDEVDTFATSDFLD